MDGVLVDNMRIHARAYDIFYERHGVGNRQNVLKELSGLGNDEIMQRLFTPERLAELGGWRALSEEKEAIYRELYEPLIRPTAGLLDFLEALRREGTSVSSSRSAASSPTFRPWSAASRSRAANPIRRSTSKRPKRCDSAPRSASYSKMPVRVSRRAIVPA